MILDFESLAVRAVLVSFSPFSAFHGRRRRDGGVVSKGRAGGSLQTGQKASGKEYTHDAEEGSET